MTLRPTEVTPASMANRRMRKKNAPVKKMVIDCKNESQWRAIHSDEVNGVVLRRRPIRAIETYLDTVLSEFKEAEKFVCSQSQLRQKLQKILPLLSEEDELRRKFLINDIAAQTRILITQTRSRDFAFRICSKLPETFQADPSAMKMILTYRGAKITFRQPKENDERSFSPYGVALFHGASYSRTDNTPVEWKAKVSDEQAFYLTIEPAGRGFRR